MRKLLYIMAGVMMVIGLNSCEKKGGIPNNDMDMGVAAMKSQMVEIVTESGPDFDEVHGPWLIPAADGKHRGGNRTCVDVMEAFPQHFEEGDFTDCGGKTDVDDGFVGDLEGFPFPVWVNPDGTIGFAAGDRECLVHAVIVKGSNQANVYVYPGGISGADGLASPAFDDGRIPWVSNVTFCCYCDEPEEPEDEFIAIKVVWDGGFAISAADASEGSNPWSGDWCSLFGVNPYPDITSIDLTTQGGASIGEAVVDSEGDVTITMDDGNLVIGTVYIYVGDMPGASSGCPVYTGWMDFDGDGDNVLPIDL